MADSSADLQIPRSISPPPTHLCLSSALPLRLGMPQREGILRGSSGRPARCRCLYPQGHHRGRPPRNSPRLATHTHLTPPPTHTATSVTPTDPTWCLAQPSPPIRAPLTLAAMSPQPLNLSLSPPCHPPPLTLTSNPHLTLNAMSPHLTLTLNPLASYLRCLGPLPLRQTLTPSPPPPSTPNPKPQTLNLARVVGHA